ncbi:Glycosyltransferase, catalytic subunit of cellulose synthase and poly-beta-1,6-N-acetylglucosamine synthase [Halolamina pelagica]|uniref:Glycosyltransferase, catalytic subunit of cellulose synthase and poly-beta-1,6-N-acetylglucosamine synthase n=2 Tax=Haloferacaceae TaxID=1644056 RepID=A0A1I5NV68_9EURY|nr:Glycosyltransferase, catalytic subunit of cellulose synthase and poly-beta-1,6-N-acetylglucosamine synthase [Halolamina pelagica]
MVLVFYLSSVLILHYSEALPGWMESVPVWTTFFLPLTIVYVLLTQLEIEVPVDTLVLLFGLILIFFYYWLIVPLALYQRLREQSRDVNVEEWPELSVLIPAYNEAGYIGDTLESFLAADYPLPKLDIIVIDDGSTDSTYEEAQAYAASGVTVLRKENGGKHSALNYGLNRTDSPLVLTVDADSVIAPDAIKSIVRSFEANPDVGAVAGNVKVSNRGSLITDLQALEYILGINTFRRVFDLLGVVTVVPGCLGLFRRDAIETVGQYSSDTLTEDFDLTIEILKRGFKIHHSNAVVQTEAPDTWTDLYQQRIRWFRGNLQTVLKHGQIFVLPEFGVLHRVGAPYLLFSMSIIPALGVIVFGLVIWFVIQGAIMEFLGITVLFMLLQVLLSLLAIHIEDEDLWLARYAPLSILGYKQFLDGVLLKSIIDIFRYDDVSWTSPERIRQRDDYDDYDD